MPTVPLTLFPIRSISDITIFLFLFPPLLFSIAISSGLLARFSTTAGRLWAVTDAFVRLIFLLQILNVNVTCD